MLSLSLSFFNHKFVELITDYFHFIDYRGYVYAIKAGNETVEFLFTTLNDSKTLQLTVTIDKVQEFSDVILVKGNGLPADYYI